MKNIKGRLLYPGFVACFLLIVLLSACDNGYQASVRSIWFYYQDDDKEIKIKEDNAIPIPDAGKDIFVKCVIPSSIKEISLKFSYDSTKLDVKGLDIAYEGDDEPSKDPSNVNNIIKLAVDNLPFNFSVKVKKNTQTSEDDPTKITVTVEPGGYTTVCKVYAQ